MLRSFDTTLAMSPDGREVVGRILPIGRRARIREPLPDGTVDEYDELFLPGCTTKMRDTARARGNAAWVRLTLDHETSFDHRIGYCTQLSESGDGVDATFVLHNDPARIDKIRSMLAESHQGLSIEFDDITRHPPTGPLRERRQIQIFAVSATPIPVYSEARILALRSDDPLAGVGTPNLDRVRAMLEAAAK